MSTTADLYRTAVNAFQGFITKRVLVYELSGPSTGMFKMREADYDLLESAVKDTNDFRSEILQSETLAELAISQQMYARIRSLDRALKMRSMGRADYWSVALDTAKNDSIFYSAISDYRIARYNEMVNRDSLPEGETTHLDEGKVTDPETGEVTPAGEAP